MGRGLVDLGSAPVLQGLAWSGLGCTLLGAALAAFRRDGRHPAAWRWVRAGFLMLTAGLGLGAFAWMEGGTFGPTQGGLATAWLLGLAALHLHHHGPWKGTRALLGLLLAWGVAAATLITAS